MPIHRVLCHVALGASLIVLSTGSALAQSPTGGTPAAVQAKLMSRGTAPDVVVPEIRIARRGGFLSVQSSLENRGDKDQGLFYRYRWLDASGGMVGDGDAWKQLRLISKSQEVIKGTAPSLSAVDFRLELSFEDQ